METELKFSPVLPESFQSIMHDPILGIYLGRLSWVQMKSVYYDTPDSALSRIGASLRMRLEDGKAVCTVKRCLSSDGNLSRRLELESCARYLTEAVRELCQNSLMPADIRDALQSDGLLPLCSADFTRAFAQYTAKTLRFDVCFDSGTLSGGKKQEDFSELELELKAGSEEAFLAIGRHISQKYNLEHCSVSKFSRARALAMEGSF